MSEKAIIVIPVEYEHLEQVAEVLHTALRAQYEATNIQPTGPVHYAIREDMELVLDVFAKPELGGGKHVARVRVEHLPDDIFVWGWALEHSLRCRRAGLLDCPITRLVGVAVDEGHMEEGDHEVRLEAGTLLWGDDL